jgi:hypothetical protein
MRSALAMPILSLMLPMPDYSEHPKNIEESLETDRPIEPQNLVYRGTYQNHPREIGENPTVWTQMSNEPSDLRDQQIDEE